MNTVALTVSWSTASPAPTRTGLATWRHGLDNLIVQDTDDTHRGEQAVQIVSIEDARDIRASRNGDSDAYGRLVSRYQDEIARYMWRFTRDRRACEELVQDTFVEAYFSLKSFRGRSPFSHWLKKIATRTGYRFWKTQARADRATGLAGQDDLARLAQTPPSDLPPSEAAELVQYLFARLRPRDRLVLTLMYLDEMPVAAIADLTGWSRTLVKVQVHRARTRLKKLMEEMGIRP
jgi:RNA polymerase sigma-70 factor (ECF subfamily)